MLKSGFLLTPSPSGGKQGPLRDPRSSVDVPRGWGRSRRGSATNNGGWGSSASGGDANAAGWPRSDGWSRPATDGTQSRMIIDEDPSEARHGGAVTNDTEAEPAKNPFEGVPFLRKNLLGTPKAELIQRLVKLHKERFPRGDCIDQNTCFISWDDKNPRTDKLMFTCVFVSPLTEEKFPSGQWGEKEYYEVREEVAATGTGAERTAVVWYKKKKWAIEAAAARALDCMSLREEVGTYGLCIEKPYLSPDDAPPLPSSMPVIKPSKTKGSGGNSDISKKSPKAEMNAPRVALKEYYEQWYKTQWSPKDYFFCLEDNDPTHKYTCVFTCPVSRERWASGQYGDTEWSDIRNDGSIPVVWYRSKKMAENAAAGRAIDCMLAREQPGTEEFEKFCVEDVYLKGEGPPLPPSMQDIPVPEPAVFELRRDVAVPMDTEDEATSRAAYKRSRADC